MKLRSSSLEESCEGRVFPDKASSTLSNPSPPSFLSSFATAGDVLSEHFRSNETLLRGAHCIEKCLLADLLAADDIDLGYTVTVSAHIIPSLGT